MIIHVFQINGIDDYFFYKINCLKEEINKLQTQYPKGVSEIKKLILNYSCYDIFIIKILKNKLLELKVNGDYFRIDKLNDFEKIIENFNNKLVTLDNFLLDGIDELNLNKIESEIFTQNIKLKFSTIKEISKCLLHSCSVFKLQKHDLVENSIIYNILDKKNNYNLYTDFNKISYLEKN